MYFFPDPPYLLFIASILAGFTSGAAFEATLKQLVREWSTHPDLFSLADSRRLPLFTPFIGMCGSACVFLASGVEIFGFSRLLAYGIAIPITLGIGRLVWTQLGNSLLELERGGSKALDLDSFE